MTRRPSSPTSTRPESPTILGGYRLLSVLGEGGMGVVYKAEDLALGRIVALKQIRPGLARNRSFLRRFRTEARALARIKSDAIVGIHALREIEDGLLIDMEFVDGPTLKTHLDATGALPWTDAVPIMRDILHAFDDAHQAGVVHRDVKPQNVMLPVEGGVKVTDFGLARMHSDSDDNTVTKGIAGTLKYMSPEQVRGSADLDARSDLFSLGLLFFEMLTGRLPFDDDASDFDVMRAIADTDLPPPRSVCPDVPADLDQIVARLLRRAPDQRYPSAADTLRDLARFAQQHAAPADAAPSNRPASSSARFGAGLGTVRLVAAAAVLVAAIAIGYVLWPTSSASDGPPPEETTVAAAIPTPATTADALSDASTETSSTEAASTETASTETTPADASDQPNRPPADAEASVRPTSTETDPVRESSTETPPPAPATLRLATPGGTVLVNGTPLPASGTASVAAGRQRIQFRHPQYGTVDTTLTVRAGSTTDLVYHFAHPVTINAIGAWGNVWIDGENRGNTPLVTRLGPGTHRVELRIDRTDAFTITGGVWTQRSDREDDRAARFAGAALDLTVRGGVVETTHTVSFTVE